MDQESGYQWVAVRSVMIYFPFLTNCQRCDDPEEPGSPICQKDVYDPTSPTPYTTTRYPPTTTRYPPTTTRYPPTTTSE